MRDYFGYAGKTCVVTGGSNGMGKATAEMLLDLGANVYPENKVNLEEKISKELVDSSK